MCSSVSKGTENSLEHDREEGSEVGAMSAASSPVRPTGASSPVRPTGPPLSRLAWRHAPQKLLQQRCGVVRPNVERKEVHVAALVLARLSERLDAGRTAGLSKQPLLVNAWKGQRGGEKKARRHPRNQGHCVGPAAAGRT